MLNLIDNTPKSKNQTSNVVEIVGNDEPVDATLQRAAANGKKVYANCRLKRAIITSERPTTKGWQLVVGKNDPEAA